MLEDWSEGKRHYSPMWRAEYILGGAEAGLPGMRRLLGKLDDRYDCGTGRGAGAAYAALKVTQPVPDYVIRDLAHEQWIDGLPYESLGSDQAVQAFKDKAGC